MSFELTNANNCDSPIVLLTNEQMREMESYVQEVVNAKTLVVGVPSHAALEGLRHKFVTLLPILDEMVRCLNSGVLDTWKDADLRRLADWMKERDSQMSVIYSGSLDIGLGALEPFPELLEQFKLCQERLQSQLEGIWLALNGSFVDLVEKSAQDLHVPA